MNQPIQASLEAQRAEDADCKIPPLDPELLKRVEEEERENVRIGAIIQESNRVALEQLAREAKAAEEPSTETCTGILDDYIEQDFESQYAEGHRLLLTTHLPLGPYGTALYDFLIDLDPAKMTYEDDDDDRSRTEVVFDYVPTAYIPNKQSVKENNYELNIEKLLAGSSDGGPVILLCQTKKNDRLPERVVMKVFDPMFYPWEYSLGEGPWRETARADMELCCEAAAYETLHVGNCDGYPHLAPKYYGAFTIKLHTFNPDLKDKSRVVGAILMEYIDGKTMGSQCEMDEDGILMPRTFMPIFKSDKPGNWTRMERNDRLKILAQLLDGIVSQMKAGVEPRFLNPEHVLLSEYRHPARPRERGQIRVTLIDYRKAVVDSKRKNPVNFYEKFSKPPHPYTRFSVKKLQGFAGWFPEEWMDDAPRMKRWLADSFGEVNGSNSRYSVRPDLDKPIEQLEAAKFI
ncbi:hypothetical protein CkaCkLH20_09655 [Colletotrichum karsti]|uniref:Uncharacterized protein n=1 Tax=Colletotrichum karsti TaxID=1095194 RepID=A0A9P6LHP5_9PEZI|nr:uncharacterized protein CkaCkLH20_09655 [Colletotrichum karsti]KAF9872792.1 hypothetical protein CkaCkLH20_09655 [Colletotrichum karsti]